MEFSKRKVYCIETSLKLMTKLTYCVLLMSHSVGNLLESFKEASGQMLLCMFHVSWRSKGRQLCKNWIYYLSVKAYGSGRGNHPQLHFSLPTSSSFHSKAFSFNLVFFSHLDNQKRENKMAKKTRYYYLTKWLT